MTSNGLYQLIVGLSAGEKRLVSIDLQSGKGDNSNFIKIFNLICLKTIDSDQLLIQQLKSVKNELPRSKLRGIPKLKIE